MPFCHPLKRTYVVPSLPTSPVRLSVGRFMRLLLFRCSHLCLPAWADTTQCLRPCSPTQNNKHLPEGHNSSKWMPCIRLIELEKKERSWLTKVERSTQLVQNLPKGGFDIYSSFSFLTKYVWCLMFICHGHTEHVCSLNCCWLLTCIYRNLTRWES